MYLCEYVLECLHVISHKLKRRLTPDVFKERVVCKTQEDFEDLKASQILDLFNPDGTAVATDGLSSVPAVSGYMLVG